MNNCTEPYIILEYPAYCQKRDQISQSAFVGRVIGLDETVNNVARADADLFL